MALREQERGPGDGRWTPQEEHRGDPSKRFILVVDSSERDGYYTATLLRNFGYPATVVRTAEEAVEMISVAVPALIVTELVLPGMNGFELFERMHRDAALASIPVVVQTGSADLESGDHCRRIGCAGFLGKPAQADDLYQIVQRSLEPTPRQNIRVTVSCRVSIDGVSSGSELVTRLSDAGLFIRTPEPREAGSRHTVTFLLGKRIIRADAVVLYAHRHADHPDREPGMGLRFLDLSPIDLDVIQSYVSEHVRPGREPGQER